MRYPLTAQIETADAKTDGCECRTVHSPAFRNLEKQRFVGLLKWRPIEHHDAIGTFSASNTASAQAVIGDRILFRDAPFGVLDQSPRAGPAPQLNLRRH